MCEILGIVKNHDAYANLEDYCRSTPLRVEGEAGIREMATLTEAGLYTLILRSDKAAAKPFIRWVTTEVLPSIRRTGSYRLPHAPSAAHKGYPLLADTPVAPRLMVATDNLRADMGLLIEAALNGEDHSDHRIAELVEVAVACKAFYWIYARDPEGRFNGRVSLGCILCRRVGLTYPLPPGGHGRIIAVGQTRGRRYISQRVELPTTEEAATP